MSSTLRTLRLRSSRAHSDRKTAVEVSSVHYARKLAKSGKVEIEEKGGGGEEKKRGRRRRGQRRTGIIIINFNNFYKFQFY